MPHPLIRRSPAKSIADAMYRIWLDSAEGRGAGRPAKDQAIYKSKRLLDFVTVTCANRCVGWTQSGRAQAATKCD